MMEYLVIASLVTPPVLVAYAGYRGVVWWRKRKSDAPAPLKEIKVEEQKFPEWNSIDVESFLEEEADAFVEKHVESSVPIWRVYRSIDRLSWVELDPASTERAACNYASHIKKLNQKEFVRVNDPDGITVFYE